MKKYFLTFLVLSFMFLSSSAISEAKAVCTNGPSASASNNNGFAYACAGGSCGTSLYVKCECFTSGCPDGCSGGLRFWGRCSDTCKGGACETQRKIRVTSSETLKKFYDGYYFINPSWDDVTSFQTVGSTGDPFFSLQSILSGLGFSPSVMLSVKYAGSVIEDKDASTTNLWSNPNNAIGNINKTTPAKYSIPDYGTSQTQTNTLRLADFGFKSSDFPADAMITGITAEVKFDGISVPSVPFYDTSVYLTKGGTSPVGENKGTNSLTKSGSHKYGNFLDKWNAGLTIADLTSPSFGVILKYQQKNPATYYSNTKTTVNVYGVKLSVYYSSGASLFFEDAYGDLAIASVKDLQAALKIPVNGVFDPTTIAELESLYYDLSTAVLLPPKDVNAFAIVYPDGRTSPFDGERFKKPDNYKTISAPKVNKPSFISRDSSGKNYIWDGNKWASSNTKYFIQLPVVVESYVKSINSARTVSPTDTFSSYIKSPVFSKAIETLPINAQDLFIYEGGLIQNFDTVSGSFTREQLDCKGFLEHIGLGGLSSAICKVSSN